MEVPFVPGLQLQHISNHLDRWQRKTEFGGDGRLRVQARTDVDQRRISMIRSVILLLAQAWAILKQRLKAS